MKRMNNLSKTFEIFDPIYGSMTFSNAARIIINKPEFQRLRYLKQLATCYLVFPSANHTRFSHSLGTYHLVDKFMISLYANSNIDDIIDCFEKISELDRYRSVSEICSENYSEVVSEICSDDEPDVGSELYHKVSKSYDLDKIKELVKIAGLCHDIGHGPYSHLFDDYFLKPKISTDFVHHEFRSTYLIKHIIENDPILSEQFTKSDIKFIQNLIDPESIHNGFIYQIVSNSLNGIDMDKFDYLTRDAYHLGMDLGFDYKKIITTGIVIDDEICYPKWGFKHLESLFEARKRLHKLIVNHPTIISSQHLVNCMLEEVNNHINIISNIEKIDFFNTLTDEYITSFVNSLTIMGKREMLSSTLIEYTKQFANRKFKKFHKIIHSDDPLDNLNSTYSDTKYEIYNATYGYNNNPNFNPLTKIQLYDVIDGQPTKVENHFIFGINHISYVYIIYEK